MKTISSPMQYWRGLCLSSTVACAMLAGGLALNTTSQAQTSSERTLATGTGLPLAADAPDTYTVKAGDTLWGISQTFLRQPWYWPELWYLNPQVQNPHLIYPGDVLSLVTIDGQPRLMVTERGAAGERVTSGNAVRLSPEVRSEPLDAITTIPYNVVAAFLGRPSVMSTDEVKQAPYLINVRDNHIIASAGDQVYARGVRSAAEGARYNVMHVNEELRDPDNNDLLAYRSAYVGTGAVVTTGDPAKLVLNETVIEALPGDKLFPESYKMNMNFVPHAPGGSVEGTIMAINDASVAGRYNVIAINRGSRAGLDVGSVLAIYQAGDVIRDAYSDGRSANPMNTKRSVFKRKVQLPDERAGTVLIFKTYERMSYALIMDATHPISVGDYVRNP